MLNVFVFNGRFVNDPTEWVTTTGKRAAKFAVAISDDTRPQDGQEEKVLFMNCVCFENNANYVMKYIKKGDMVSGIGRITQSHWKTQNGDKRTSYSTTIQRIYKIKDSMNNGSREEISKPNVSAAMGIMGESNNGYYEVPDDELPFL